MADARPLIVVVDDDEHDLALTTRAVERRYTADYDIWADLTAEAALRRLDDGGAKPEVALVLAELTMPDQNGIEFLTRVAALAPNAKRVLLVHCGELELTREPILRWSSSSRSCSINPLTRSVRAGHQDVLAGLALEVGQTGRPVAVQNGRVLETGRLDDPVDGQELAGDHPPHTHRL